MTDLEYGRQALTYFHNASLKFAAYGGRSFEDLLALYGNKANIYADGIGFAISSTGLSDSKVKTAMETLAKKTQGNIPKDHQAYINALSNKAQEINYLDMTAKVATGVAKDVTSGAVALGDSVITSAKWVTTLLPVIAVGAVIFFIYSHTKGSSDGLRDVMRAAAKKGAAAVKRKVSKKA